MTAKQDFTTKVQTNVTNKQTQDTQVQADISAFSTGMFQLGTTIKNFFSGTGLLIGTSVDSLNFSMVNGSFTDPSITLSTANSYIETYSITFITMQYRQNIVTLAPYALYGGDASGTAILTVVSPEGLPRKEIYVLSMAADYTWSIRNLVDAQDVAQPLVEESFFSAIANLV